MARSSEVLVWIFERLRSLLSGFCMQCSKLFKGLDYTMMSMIVCTIQILDTFPRYPVLSPWHPCQLLLDIVRILMDSVLLPCSQQTQQICTTFVGLRRWSHIVQMFYKMLYKCVCVCWVCPLRNGAVYFLNMKRG